MTDVKALIAEALTVMRERPGLSDSVAETILKLVKALEFANAEMHARELHHFETEKLLTEAGIDPDTTRPALMVESREALASWMHSRQAFEYGECDHGFQVGSWVKPGEKIPYAMCERWAYALLASGVVRLAADVVREAKAEAWDEGVVALARRKDWHWPVNPYRTEGEGRP